MTELNSRRSSRHQHSSLPHSLYSARQLRDMDRQAIEGGDDHKGLPGLILMERAGAVTFRAMRRRWRSARRMAVICGIGNNAGDGYVVARLALEHRFLKPVVLYVGDRERLKGDALNAAKAYEEAGGRAHAFDPARLADMDVLVDALFGIGLEREVTGAWRQVIEAINASPAPVVAVDVPSGLHSDTGRVMGIAIRASLTVSFIGLKKGLWTGEGPDCTGQVEYDSLGVPGSVIRDVQTPIQRIDHRELRAHLLPRARHSHKGEFGHVLVVGGEMGYAGAARMAAEAAARCGAGLISVATRRKNIPVMLSGRPEIMAHDIKDEAELLRLQEKVSLPVLGPGLGQSDWARSLWGALVGQGRSMVLDADGLNLLAKASGRSGSRRVRLNENTVITPHPGEAARLLGISNTEVQADRYAAVLALQQKFRCLVVLKGAGTLVAGPEGQIRVSQGGNPGMASGGMGDVLSGIIAGLLAQRQSLHLSAFEATQLAVWLHGEAADRCAQDDGERGMLASDLFPYLRDLLNP